MKKITERCDYNVKNLAAKMADVSDLELLDIEGQVGY